MRAVVAYDTHHGNTKIVAEAITEQLRAEGHEAELRDVRDRHPEHPRGDILFPGSPVRMGAVSRRVKREVSTLDEEVWRDTPIVVFTTTLKLPKDATDEQKRNQDTWDWGAGRKIRDLAKSRGLNVPEKHLWGEVTGLKGPLVEAGIQSARPVCARHPAFSEAPKVRSTVKHELLTARTARTREVGVDYLLHTRGEREIAEITAVDTLIMSAQDFLDLIANTPSRNIIVRKEMLDEAFFDLRTGIAGDILQKSATIESNWQSLATSPSTRARACETSCRKAT